MLEAGEKASTWTWRAKTGSLSIFSGWIIHTEVNKVLHYGHVLEANRNRIRRRRRRPRSRYGQPSGVGSWAARPSRRLNAAHARRRRRPRCPCEPLRALSDRMFWVDLVRNVTFSCMYIICHSFRARAMKNRSSSVTGNLPRKFSKWRSAKVEEKIGIILCTTESGTCLSIILV